MSDTDRILDQMAAEAEEIERQRQMRLEGERVEKAAAEWRAKWPNACSACHGHGGSTFYESHGDRHGRAEQLFEPCEALPPKTCHRCLADGLTEDGEGPCTICGWNFNDGEPGQ